MRYTSDKYKEFYNIISDMDVHPTVQEMKKYRQHYDCSCYDHCLSVAYYCFCICKKLHLDEKSMARAAFVHDLFLYDWRVRQPNRKGLHAFTHAKTAYNRASHIFSLNDKERDIILKHMWPVTLVPPRYLESYILTLVDKYTTIEESYLYYKKKIYCRKMFQTASSLLLLLFIYLP